MKPFRSHFWLEEVGPVSHDAVVDYLCLTPHWTPVTIQGGTMQVVGYGWEDLGGQLLPARAPPAGIDAIARSELLRLVPGAKDVTIHYERSHRPLRVRELMRVGPSEIIVADSVWDPNAELTAVDAPPANPTVHRVGVPSFRSCSGRWFAFESPRHTEPAPVLPHALARRATSQPSVSLQPVAPDLAGDFGRALLSVARASLGEPANSKRSRHFQDLPKTMRDALLPARDQHVEFYVNLGSTGIVSEQALRSGTVQPPARERFRVGTTQLVFSGFTERRAVNVAGHPVEIRVAIEAERGPDAKVVDADAVVPLTLTLQLRSHERELFEAEYQAEIHAVVDRGRAMTRGMTASPGGGAAPRWNGPSDDGLDASKIEIPDSSARLAVQITPLRPCSGIEDEP
jgi:hypothetical protein